MNLPSGWTSEPFDREGRYVTIVTASSPRIAVTIDFERRGFTGGWSMCGSSVTARSFRGRGWRDALVASAVEWLRGIEAKNPCRHFHSTLHQLDGVVKRRCDHCAALLSMGPSNDTPAKVATEIRAAEIADPIYHTLTHEERVGWLDGANDGHWKLLSGARSHIETEDPGYQAGFLAWCIYEHDHAQDVAEAA